MSSLRKVYKLNFLKFIYIFNLFIYENFNLLYQKIIQNKNDFSE